jgi:hypothetical protein
VDDVKLAKIKGQMCCHLRNGCHKSHSKNLDRSRLKRGKLFVSTLENLLRKCLSDDAEIPRRTEAHLKASERFSVVEITACRRTGGA